MSLNFFCRHCSISEGLPEKREDEFYFTHPYFEKKVGSSTRITPPCRHLGKISVTSNCAPVVPVCTGSSTTVSTVLPLVVIKSLIIIYSLRTGVDGPFYTLTLILILLLGLIPLMTLIPFLCREPIVQSAY